MVLGVSAKEWAITMLKEETELDTLALIAIRNMLGVSFFFCYFTLFLQDAACVIRISCLNVVYLSMLCSI